jgi:hypothetical protein
LNCCYSTEHAQMVSAQKGIPAIGVEGQVTDDVAIRFSDLFYQYLVEGISIGAAYAQVKWDLDNKSSSNYYQTNI